MQITRLFCAQVTRFRGAAPTLLHLKKLLQAATFAPGPDADHTTLDFEIDAKLDRTLGVPGTA